MITTLTLRQQPGLKMIYGLRHSPYVAVIRVKKMGYRKHRSDIPMAPFYRTDFRVFMVVRGNKIPGR